MNKLVKKIEVHITSGNPETLLALWFHLTIMQELMVTKNIEAQEMAEATMRAANTVKHMAEYAPAEAKQEFLMATLGSVAELLAQYSRSTGQDPSEFFRAQLEELSKHEVRGSSVLQDKLEQPAEPKPTTIAEQFMGDIWGDD